jgi:hypothetical protein
MPEVGRLIREQARQACYLQFPIRVGDEKAVHFSQRIRGVQSLRVAEPAEQL